MVKEQSLAILGGDKAVTTSKPHEIWPPKASETELHELWTQRNSDISIKGRTGPIQEFEKAFLDFLGNKVKYAVTFNSGTSALFAAYFAIGLEEGTELIGPALTYHAALSPAFILRSDVVLVDIDIRNRCIDHKRIEAAITERTKAITVVHQWGHPCDMDPILALANKYSLKVIEDCSHAHGSAYKGKLCGTFGDVAVFSLQANKAIFAGEGGILVTNNTEIHDKVTLLGHYRDRSKEEVENPDLQKYWVTGFGLKLRMSPFNAIVALHSLRNYKNIKAERHRCLNYFRQELKQIAYIEAPHVSDDVDMGAWYGFKPLYIADRLGGLPRETLIKALQAEGVEIDIPSAPVLATLPLYNETQDKMISGRKKKVTSLDSLPNAKDVAERSLSLPTFSNWERDKKIIDEYILAFKKIEQHYKQLLDYASGESVRAKYVIPEAELRRECLDEKIDMIVVGAAIENHEMLFLARRAAGIFMAGKYELPGGYMTEHETMEQAVRREVFEEAGLKVTEILGRIAGFDYEHKGKKARQFNFVVRTSGGKITLDLGEHDDFSFVTEQSAQTMDLTNEMRGVVNSFFEFLKEAPRNRI